MDAYRNGSEDLSLVAYTLALKTLRLERLRPGMHGVSDPSRSLLALFRQLSVLRPEPDTGQRLSECGERTID
jgi:hypothetical protein